MTESIDWGGLPNISPLTVEYIAGNRSVIELLGGDWRQETDRARAADSASGFNRPQGLGSAIRKQYDGLEIPLAVGTNLGLLDKPDTLAVVTGQQVGIFGGPMYTFLKALTTVMFAEQLKGESDAAVVPVFWMETADADFSEINRIAFPAADDEPRRAVYAPHNVVPGHSVKYHRFTGEIDRITELVRNWIRPLPFHSDLDQIISQSYRSKTPITAAFRVLMNAYFGDRGLVLFDPLEPDIASRLAGAWDLFLENPTDLNAPFEVASRSVEDNRLPLQVRLRGDALPIFHIKENGMRHRIVGKTDSWRISPDEPPVDDQRLRALAKGVNGSLSPSVLLRPLCQDYLLPTWIYIAGPAEIAYHAQAGSAYKRFGIPRPLIAPRISATIIDRNARRRMQKYGWTISEAFGGKEMLLRRSGRSESLAALFDNGAEQLEGWLERFERSADEAGINISQELDRAGRKLKYQWERLRRITLNKIAERDKARVMNAEKTLMQLLPDGMLQERHDSMLYYLCAYGNQIVDSIESKTDLFDARHKVIELE